MKRLKFKCHFLSDVVLNAQTASEGSQSTLDYVPGSNFLGVVAKKYKELGDKAYDIFHSGKVSFGDAHLSEGSEKSYKAPLSWFINKGDKVTDTVWIHHALDQEMRNALTNSDKSVQLKQVRTGWISSDNKVLEAEKNFAIKSAYNRQERRSEDGQLYGYQSLKAGSEWIFYVDVDESVDSDVIKSELCGEKSIGRSRSAQFGRIKIDFLENISNTFESVNPVKVDDGFYIFAYAESRLAFKNKYGQETYQPDSNDFGVDGKIDWSLSQIKSGVFAPWSSINNSRLKDRCYIEKGSVIAIKVGSANPVGLNSSGIGLYINEGFGNVAFNPDFLDFKSDGTSTLTLTKDENKNRASQIVFTQKEDASDQLVFEWLTKQKDIANHEKAIFENVKNFCEKKSVRFSRITSSQWGQVRACATTAESYDQLMLVLFDKKSNSESLSQVRSQDGLLRHGKTEKAWKSCYDVLEEELKDKKKYGTEYAERLATQMQKIAKPLDNNKEA